VPGLERRLEAVFVELVAVHACHHRGPRALRYQVCQRQGAAPPRQNV
jgi:hypothetical protein